MSKRAKVRPMDELRARIPRSSKAGGQAHDAAHAPVCVGCGGKASFRLVAEDLRTGEQVYVVYLCDLCLARKFVAMRPYMARVRPRFFDEPVIRGLI